MDTEDNMKKLARIAQRERIPEIDVTAGVFRRLKAPLYEKDRSLFWLLAGSGTAAAAAAGYALAVVFQDPIADFASLQDPIISLVSFMFSFASSFTGVQL